MAALTYRSPAAAPGLAHISNTGPSLPFKHGLCSSPTFLQPPVLVTAGNTWLWAGRPWKSHAGLCFALFPEEARPTVRRQLQQLVGISEVHHLVASIVSILL